VTDSRPAKAPSSAPDPSELPTPPPGLKTQPRGGEGARRGHRCAGPYTAALALLWAGYPGEAYCCTNLCTE
jgi:hypothetical protein